MQFTAQLPSLLPDTATISPTNTLELAGLSVAELARTYNTPLYIFDRATIVNACREYQDAFQRHYVASHVQILYAAKAYLSPMLARLVAEQGMGLDVVSGGELLVAQRAGFPMERVSFHGNNKSEAELRLALQLGVGRIVLDNWHELMVLTRIAHELALQPRVLLRVAPGVETDTHQYLQTGHASSKFGIPLQNGEAKAAIRRIIDEKRLILLGLHAHSGTMLRETRPYEECLERLLRLAMEMRDEVGWWPEEICPGGGWAVPNMDDVSTPPVEKLAQALHQSMLTALSSIEGGLSAPRLLIEPGRSIIARAGMAVYRIGARKVTPGGITYLFVDGGMADNIRPALYGAGYTAMAIERMADSVQENVCIAGRYCESGDVLISDVTLPYMQENELIALPMVGAYCLPMASNYNLVPRPAVILVDEKRVHIMERRETYTDIMTRYL